MATFYTPVETDEGIAHVLTKTRYLGIIPWARTSVTPHSRRELATLGSAISWLTKDAATLRELHERVVQLVAEIGISGIRACADSARMSDQIAKGFGGSWRDVVESAAQNGVSFPIPPNVLRQVKRFI